MLLAAVGLARAALAGGQELLAGRASGTVRAQLRSGDAVRHRARVGRLWAQRQPGGRLANATGPGVDALDGYVTRALPALVTASVVPVGGRRRDHRRRLAEWPAARA